ncbi:MAG: anhydro-N-acetylmuramic acid kinase [Parvularculaceae bacterium]
MTNLTAIGLASDASLEGIRAAILSTDGEGFFEAGPDFFQPFSRDLKIFINRAAKAAREGREGAADIGKAGGEFTGACINAVEELLERNGIKRTHIDVIGVGGHEIHYQPRRSSEAMGRSLRIGDGKTIAEESRIDVVSNLADMDLAEGGAGRPIEALYLAALARAHNAETPNAIVKIGDRTMIIYTPANASLAELSAFDAGPAKQFLEEWISLKAGAEGLSDEALRRGAVHTDVLRLMLLNPYLRRKPPKFFDARDFKLDPLLGLSLADGAATIVAFIAACVRAALEIVSAPPAEWIIVDGCRGAPPAIFTALEKALAGPVTRADAGGWREDYLDAENAAFLAVRSLRKLPLTFPGATRVARPMRGGVHWRAPR